MMVVRHGLDGVEGLGDLIAYGSSLSEAQKIADFWAYSGKIEPGTVVTLLVNGEPTSYAARSGTYIAPVPEPELKPEPVVADPISIPADLSDLVNQQLTTAQQIFSPSPVCPSGQEWSFMLNRCYIVGVEDPITGKRFPTTLDPVAVPVQPPEPTIVANAYASASIPDEEIVTLTNGVESSGANGANGNGAPACPAGQLWSDLINRCYVVGQEDPQEIAAWWEQQQAQPDVTSPVPSLITADTRVPVPPVPVQGPRPPLYQDFEDCIPGDQDCIDRNAARAAANQVILTNHGNEYLRARCERSNALNINAGHPELERDCVRLFPIMAVPTLPSARATPTAVSVTAEPQATARTVVDEAGVAAQERVDSGMKFEMPSGVTEVLTGEVIGGVPNWMLAVGVLAGLMFMRGGR